MATKKPGQITDDDNVLDFMNIRNNVAEQPIGDPIAVSRIRVTLDQLEPYDNNPRTSDNPKYDEILASIEARGLDNPPNISRRHPDDEKYIIIDGGNTRLAILHELHQKYSRLLEQATTDEERIRLMQKAEQFYVLDCIFKPWQSESHALAGHMCENELRGDTKFVEKAVAIQKFRDMYADEDKQARLDAGEELDEDYQPPRLSIRELAERISQQGWTISIAHISRMDYTTEILLPVIPQALWAGAGGPLVKNIRRHERGYLKFWQTVPETDHTRADISDITDYFFEQLHKFDYPDLDFKSFTTYFNGMLADKIGIPVMHLSAEINAIMRGRSSDEQPIINVPPEFMNAQHDGDDMEAIARRYRETRNPGETVTDPGAPVSRGNKAPATASSQQPTSPAVTPQGFCIPPDFNGKCITILDINEYFAKKYSLMMVSARNPASCTDPLMQYTPCSITDNEPFTDLDNRTPLVIKYGEDARAAVWWAISRTCMSYKEVTIEHFVNGPLAGVYQHYMPHVDDDIIMLILRLEELLITALPDDEIEKLSQLQRLTKAYRNQYQLIKKESNHE